MSLQLNDGTEPENLEVRTYPWHEHVFDYPGTVIIGDYIFQIDAFLGTAKKVVEIKRSSGRPESWGLLRKNASSLLVVSTLGWSRSRSHPLFVKMGAYKLSMDDFLCVTTYVLTNFNLIDHDPRIHFVEWIRSHDVTLLKSLNDSDPRIAFIKRVIELQNVKGFPAYTCGKLANPYERRLATKEEVAYLKSNR